MLAADVVADASRIMERLLPTDIADAIHFIVSRPRRIAVNEMLVRPTGQQA
jgi:NADP-dependent 3-hydroxy acid dehydrogenase YdfG